jgi:prefoldin subunit 5
MLAKEQEIAKAVKALNELQRQSAAIYAEVMSLSAKISEALRKEETVRRVSDALEEWTDQSGGHAAKAEEGELDIF